MLVDVCLVVRAATASFSIRVDWAGAPPKIIARSPPIPLSKFAPNFSRFALRF
jgi:hypothetical protein